MKINKRLLGRLNEFIVSLKNSSAKLKEEQLTRIQLVKAAQDDGN